MQEVFKRLKQLFTDKLILQIFDLRKKINIKTDISNQVLESVLSQLDKSKNL